MKDDSNISSRLFTLLGEFSQVQTAIDENLAELFFSTKTPATAGIVREKLMKRLRDDDRPGLVLAIAKDVNSDADLSEFSNVFHRAKRLRDKAAHALFIREVSTNEVELIFSPRDKKNPKPITVSREEIDQAVWNCAWLFAQIQYLFFESELIDEGAAGQLTVQKPTRTPAEWSGISVQIVEWE